MKYKVEWEKACQLYRKGIACMLNNHDEDGLFYMRQCAKILRCISYNIDRTKPNEVRNTLKINN